MKIKKILLLVSMLAVMFSLAGCDESKEKPFEYDETDIVLHTMGSFITYSNIPEEYADYYLTDGNDYEKSAIKGIKQAQTTDNVGEFENYAVYADSVVDGTFTIDMVDGKIVNNDDSVSVTINNKAANRDVEITVKYIENADYYIMYNELSASINDNTVENALLNNYYTYGIDPNETIANSGCSSFEEFVELQKIQTLSQQGIYRYEPVEMVVSAVYSKSELMKQAGMNTLIGMGTVFVVLIFISFIISLFKYLPALFAKKPKIEVEKKAEPVKAAPVAEAPKAADENLVDDAELVAVIMAAIYAASGQAGAVSKDKLVVRSIKKVKR